jgi:hypothetical protein
LLRKKGISKINREDKEKAFNHMKKQKTNREEKGNAGRVYKRIVY